MKAPILLCLLFAGCMVLGEMEDPTKDIKAVRGVFEVRAAAAAFT